MKMKTKQITTESGIVLLLVEVAPDATNINILKEDTGYCKKGDLVYDTNLNFWKHGNVILPEGNWQGKHFKEMSEEETHDLVEWGMDYHDEFGYYNYEQDSSSLYKYPFKTALESMSSRIRSYGFDPENTVVLTLKD